MGMDAIAVLHVSLSDLEARLGRHPEDAEGHVPLRGAHGGPVPALPLEDATLIHTGVPFASEPEHLSRALRMHLGEALDLHSDPRGVYFYPEVAEATEPTYDALLEELGEGGMWAPLAETLDPQALMGAMGDPNAILQQAQAMLAQGSFQDAIQDLLGPEGMAQVQSMMGQVMQGGAIDPEAIAKARGSQPEEAEADDAETGDAGTGETELDEGGVDDVAARAQLEAAVGGDLFAQAQAMAQQMLKDDPGLADRLAARFSSATGQGDEGEPENGSKAGGEGSPEDTEK